MVEDDTERGVDPGGARDQACNTCARLYPDHGTCEAYPDGEGIPDVILNGLFKHLTPWPGDHGLMYVWAPSEGPKPGWAP
jgi:hypothetical protein